MDIFSFITLFGGLALFIFGMNQMSISLEKVAGGKMEAILNRMTANRYMGLLLGALITIAIQSSSAVTVMLVGLVNSGILDISNTVGVIMGSNIGTTITAWIMSLIGVSGDHFIVRILKPESFSPVLAFIGVIMIMMSKTEKNKDIGRIFVGFAILMYGMTFMSDSMAPLAESPKFRMMLTAFNNPVLGILIGCAVTAVIQSSSASVGMLQALSMTGQITWNIAIPIIMGQNIGTCATAILSSIGVNRNAKRVSIIHILFNLIGTFVFMVLYFIMRSFIDKAFLAGPINPVGVALFHTIFNVGTTLLVLPFGSYLVKVAKRLVKTDERKESFLDDRLLNTPAIAVAECNKYVDEMGLMAKESMDKSMKSVFKYEENVFDEVVNLENRVDEYEDKIGSFLLKVSSNNLSAEDSKQVSKMLHTIGDFERISDHAINIAQTAKYINEKGVRFSQEAEEELRVISRAINEILKIASSSYIENDVELAKRAEPLEEVVDRITEKAKLHHIERLQNGTCTLENGVVLTEMMTDYERVSDHCSNVAVAVIELARDSFGVHEYLEEERDMTNPEFKELYKLYKKKYQLPRRINHKDRKVQKERSMN